MPLRGGRGDANVIRGLARSVPRGSLSGGVLRFISARAARSHLSKLITRAALSARRLSRRGLGLSLCRRVKFTTALPLGVSLSQTPHRAH